MSGDPLLYFAVLDVSQGRIVLLATARGLARVILGPSRPLITHLEGLAAEVPPLALARGSSLLAGIAGTMRRYFMGRRVDFGQTPLDLGRATDFQRAVWRLVSTIPYGSVRSYGWLASRLEGRGCARAVGQALARNPVPVVVPCHRVIEESGARGGFTAGEAWKDVLLEIEGGEQRLKLRERRVRRPPTAGACSEKTEAAESGHGKEN